MRTSRSGVVGTVVAVVVAAAVVAGLILLGAPAEERARRLDERRVQDLSGIARAADVYWTRNRRLPDSLEELRRETGVDVAATDPATNAQYQFRPLDGTKYELCATFDNESRESDRGGEAGFWSHRAGRQCFEREAMTVR
jgi:hypothetical protein